MPSSTPVWEAVVWLETARARPKSATFTVPSSSRRMTFSGLTSRWMMPARWAAPSACSTGRHDVEGSARGERPLGLHHLAQGLPGDVLHGEEHVAVVLALVEDGDDVGVRQPGRRAGLALEPADERVVLGEVAAQHLEGDVAVEPGVEGEVDRRHPAVGDVRQDAVAPVENTPEQGLGHTGRHLQSVGGRAGHLVQAGRGGAPGCDRGAPPASSHAGAVRLDRLT